MDGESISLMKVFGEIIGRKLEKKQGSRREGKRRWIRWGFLTYVLQVVEPIRKQLYTGKRREGYNECTS